MATKTVKRTAAKKAPAKTGVRRVALVGVNPAAKTLRKKNPVKDVPGDFSQSSEKVYGRAWSDSEKAQAKTFPDCVQVRFTWKDGEWLQMLYETKAGAIAGLRSAGYNVSQLK